jgi:hypothetical protein
MFDHEALFEEIGLNLIKKGKQETTHVLVVPAKI